jgi:hypothetical protein
VESSQGRLSANSLAIAQEGRHRVPRQARVGEHRHALRGTHLAEARATANAATNHAGLIWAIADLLRGDYKQSEYGRVILPVVLLRRLDCVLEPTKAQVLARVKTLTVQTVGPVLKTVTGIEAYNTSRLNLRAILADPSQVAGNLRAWIAAFDVDTRDVIEKFDFDAQIGRLDRLHMPAARLIIGTTSHKVCRGGRHPKLIEVWQADMRADPTTLPGWPDFEQWRELRHVPDAQA